LDCTRLLDTFLAGRNPRTLAAYQADLEDFRRFIETRAISPPTVGEAVQWLLGIPEGLAIIYVLNYRSGMIKRGLRITTTRTAS
jgi:hypothetical protein